MARVRSDDRFEQCLIQQTNQKRRESGREWLRQSIMEKPWLKSYEKGVPEFIKYEEICMPDILDRTAKQFADKPALIFQGTTRHLRAAQGDGGPLCRLPGRFRGQEGGCRGDPPAQHDPLRRRLLRDPEDRGDRRDEQPPLFGSGAGTPVQRFRRQGPDHAGCPGQTG